MGWECAQEKVVRERQGIGKSSENLREQQQQKMPF